MRGEDGGREGRVLASVPHLVTGVEEVIAEAAVGLEQVGLDATRRLDGHLGAVLQDGHWELVAGQASKPQAEVPVHLVAMFHMSTETHTWCSPRHQAPSYPGTVGHPQPDSTPLGGPGQAAPVHRLRI